MRTTFLKLTGIVALFAVVFTACDKNESQDISPLSLNSELAVVSLNTVVTGSFTTPQAAAGGSTGDWGEVYYDLYENQVTSSTAPAFFDGAWCGDLYADSTYTLGYVDISGTSLSAVTQSALAAATLNTPDYVGYNGSGTGWYTYGGAPTYSVGPVANRYVVLFRGSSIASATALYVLQINTIGYTPETGTSNYFGNVSFNYKRLI